MDQETPVRPWLITPVSGSSSVRQSTRFGTEGPQVQILPSRPTLADACLHALSSPRPGTRLWAAEQLAVLQVDRTAEALEAALQDPEDEVRAAIQSALDALRPLDTHIGRQQRR